MKHFYNIIMLLKGDIFAKTVPYIYKDKQRPDKQISRNISEIISNGMVSYFTVSYHLAP